MHMHGLLKVKVWKQSSIAMGGLSGGKISLVVIGCGSEDVIKDNTKCVG